MRVELLAVVFLVFSNQAGAHHSTARFDLSATVSFDAVVTEFEWKNPHVFIHVERVDDGGEVTALQIEADGVSMLLPHSWSRESLRPGDRVRVEAYLPKSSARRSLLGYSLTKQDGTVLAPNPDRFQAAVSVTPSRTSGISGVWLPRWDSFFALSNTPWPLTEQGRQFRDAPESAQNPLYKCVPFATPRIMVTPVRTEIEVLSDRVLIRVDWLDVERAVYTDGREHPTDGRRTIQGHSIGYWEDDTLVMDTTLFNQDSMGETGLPSGPRRHIEERLSLGGDGESLSYEFVLEDLEYLLEPVSGRGVWDFRPELEASSVDCDLGAARRDLEPIE